MFCAPCQYIVLLKWFAHYNNIAISQVISFPRYYSGGSVAEWFRALDLKSGGPWFCYLDLFSVVPSSTPQPRCVNSQLVSLPPVGILNSLCSIWSIKLFIDSVPN